MKMNDTRYAQYQRLMNRSFFTSHSTHSRLMPVALKQLDIRLGLFKASSQLIYQNIILTVLTGQPTVLRYQFHGKRQRRTVSLNADLTANLSWSFIELLLHEITPRMYDLKTTKNKRSTSPVNSYTWRIRQRMSTVDFIEDLIEPFMFDSFKGVFFPLTIHMHLQRAVHHNRGEVLVRCFRFPIHFYKRHARPAFDDILTISIEESFGVKPLENKAGESKIENAAGLTLTAHLYDVVADVISENPESFVFCIITLTLLVTILNNLHFRFSSQSKAQITASVVMPRQGLTDAAPVNNSVLIQPRWQNSAIVFYVDRASQTNLPIEDEIEDYEYFKQCVSCEERFLWKLCRDFSTPCCNRARKWASDHPKVAFLLRKRKVWDVVCMFESQFGKLFHWSKTALLIIRSHHTDQGASHIIARRQPINPRMEDPFPFRRVAEWVLQDPVKSGGAPFSDTGAYPLESIKVLDIRSSTWPHPAIASVEISSHEKFIPTEPEPFKLENIEKRLWLDRFGLEDRMFFVMAVLFRKEGVIAMYKLKSLTEVMEAASHFQRATEKNPSDPDFVPLSILKLADASELFETYGVDYREEVKLEDVVYSS